MMKRPLRKQSAREMTKMSAILIIPHVIELEEFRNSSSA